MLNLLTTDETSLIPLLKMDEGSARPCFSCEGYRPHPQGDGNLQVDPEIHLPSPGMDVDIAHYYNSLSTINGPYGYGRTLSTYATARAYGTLASTTYGSGEAILYQVGLAQTPGYINITPGSRNTLVQDTVNNQWVETTPTGHVRRYPLDTAGNTTTIISEQDAAGNLHSYLYGQGLLVAQVDALGRTVTHSYYADGLLQSIMDWAGRITSFAYDVVTAAPLNLLTTVTGPSGCQTAYQYATFALSTSIMASGYDWLLAGITDPNGFSTTYTYDNMRRVATRSVATAGTWHYQYQPTSMTFVNPLGQHTTQTLDSNFQMVGLKDALGNMVTMTRNTDNQETSRTNPHGVVITTTYDINGNVSSVVNALGATVVTTYDTYNNVLSIQQPDGTIVTNIWGYAGSAFDTTGAKRRLQASIDPLGNRNSYTYNGRGQMVGEEDPLGNRTTYAYDSWGNRSAIEDPLGRLTTMVHDLAGNVVQTIDPLGHVWSTTYDPQNRPLTVTDPLGNTTTFGYDSVGNRTIEIDPLGYRTSWTFGVFDKPTSRTDPLGRTDSWIYDALGRNVATIDAAGNVSTIAYDIVGRAVATVDPLGNIATVVYDAVGQVLTRQDAEGHITTAVYDNAGRQTSTIDALGNRNTAIYDSLNRVVATVDALGHMGTTVYDAAGRRIAEIDALGYAATLVFDAAGRTTASVNSLGFANTNIYDAAGRTIARIDPFGFRTSSVYDSGDRLVAVQNARGYINTNLYDAANRALARQDALGNFTTSQYDARSLVISNVDALGRVSTNVYDAAAQNIAQIDALGNYTSSIYDVTGRQIASQDAEGNFTTSVYDRNGRQVVSISPLGYRTSTTYDLNNRPIAVQDPLGFTASTMFDPLGRAISTVDALGHIATSTYDVAGRQIAVINALGYAITSVYDGANRVIASQNELGCFTSFTLDALGRQTAVVDSNGQTTSNLYDQRSNLLSTQNSLGAFTSWQYDANGNAAVRIDGRGYPTTYTMDALDRTVGTLYPNGGCVTVTFNAAGEQVTQQDGLGIRTTVFDLAGRQVSVAFPSGLILSYHYNASGSRTGLIDATGMTTYTWDAEERVTGVVNPLGEVTTISYDPLGRDVLRVLSNGTTSTRAFDAAGREIARGAFGPSGAATALFTNTYDAAGNRTGILELNGTTLTCTYDPASQLTREQRSGSLFGATISTGLNAYDIAYTYDNCGNRLVQNHNGRLTTNTYNVGNELVGILPPSGISSTLTYDGNGNVSTVTTANALTSCTWDYENRLAGQVDVSSVLESNTYSSDGLRQDRLRLAPITNSNLDAQFISQAVPPIMVAGGTYGVAVTMRNIGTTAWTAAASFRLGSENPNDNTIWGLNRVDLPYRVEPGADVTFNFAITAPVAAGNYNFQWQMLQEGVAHFGQLTDNVSVGVYLNPLGNQAQWIAQTVPANMVAGEDYPVSITMLNIGSTTWEPTTLHNLGSQDPQDNEIWGMGRVVMPIASAPPGTSVDFVFTVTAPSTPGTYAFQWEMVQDGVEHFGDFTPLVSVQVGASEVGTPDGLLTALWDSDNLLLELDAALTVTGRYTGTPDAWGGLISQWQQAQLVDRWNSPSSSFYAFDSQGSTRLLTNPAGAVTDAYAYRAFGAAWQGGNGSANAYRYAGEYGYYRDSAAVEYVRARWLAVGTGRWLNEDPIARVGYEKFYSFQRNNTSIISQLGDNAHAPVYADDNVSCRHCKILCSVNVFACLACWRSCKMRCDEWGDPHDAPQCAPGDTPVFITTYSDPGEQGRCAVYCPTTWCCSHCHRRNKAQCSRGSDRPLCNVKMHPHVTVPGFGRCIVNNGGCGQHPANVPRPNHWMDFWSYRNVKCWVCMSLPTA